MDFFYRTKRTLTGAERTIRFKMGSVSKTTLGKALGTARNGPGNGRCDSHPAPGHQVDRLGRTAVFDCPAELTPEQRTGQHAC